MLTDADSEQAKFKKKAPNGELQPYGGKAQSQPPAGVENPACPLESRVELD